MYKDTCNYYANVNNPYYYHKLIKNYIYKGPVEEWYIRVKVNMEHRYEFFDKLIPRKAMITDIGCGFGPLTYMLMMLSEDRTLLGIDYDEEKIAVANHNFSRTRRIRFECANALTYDLPQSDVFILNDMLHYIDNTSQEELLNRCVRNLAPGGMIIVRDSNSNNQKGHKITRLSELFSTRLLHFNKTEGQLYFPSEEQFEQFAAKHHLQIEKQANDKYTSNTIYLFRRKEETNE